MTFGELRFNLVQLIPAVSPDVLDTAINNRLESIARHLPWKALEADGLLSTVAAFQGQGTVAVTLGSNAVVLTGAVWTVGMTGMLFRTLERSETYTFTYTGATTGTLDRPYEGDTEAAGDFILYKNVYPLPSDFGEPIRGRNERIPMALQYWNRSELDDSAPARSLIGEPMIWTEAARVGNARYAELYPAPEDAAVYPIRYRRTMAQLTDTNAADALPDWISTRGLMAGVRADVTGDVKQEATYQTELAQMRREDSAARGPEHIREAAWMTRHYLARTINNYRRRLP